MPKSGKEEEGGRRERMEGGNGPLWVNPPLPGGVAFAEAREGQPEEMTLHEAERALLSPKASGKRVAEFTLGRGCARRALARLDPALGGSPILRRGERAPAWPEGIVGTITHHGAWAAAAVARAADYRGLGLDLEAVRAPSDGLVRRILRPEEREILNGAPPETRALRFMLAFSAKESLFKALHPLRGVYLGFQEASVRLPEGGPGDGGALAWRLEVDYGEEMPRGFEGQGRYAVAGTDAGGQLVLTGVWLPA